jgi:hypothetical protein
LTERLLDIRTAQGHRGLCGCRLRTVASFLPSSLHIISPKHRVDEASATVSNHRGRFGGRRKGRWGESGWGEIGHGYRVNIAHRVDDGKGIMRGVKLVRST